MDHDIKERIEKTRKQKWIEASMFIEAIAVKQEVVEDSLKSHIEKLDSIKDIFVYEKNFKETIKIEKPLKNVDEAYSQIVEVKLFTKDLFSLMTIIILYGPSSVEVLGPKNVSLNIEELQHISNSVADLIHQFASAGAGGIVFMQKSSKK